LFLTTVLTPRFIGHDGVLKKVEKRYVVMAKALIS